MKEEVRTNRANSIAPALHGEVQSWDITVSLPSLPSGILDSRSINGVNRGDENDRRYSATKKSSFRAHTIKRTRCRDISSYLVYLGITHSIRIIDTHDPRSILIHLFMALTRAAYY